MFVYIVRKQMKYTNIPPEKQLLGIAFGVLVRK
jgi:hypothetical protein